MSLPDQYIWFSESNEPEGPYQTKILLDKEISPEMRSTCRLILSLEPDRLRYVLLSAKGEWLQAKSYESTGLLSQDMFLRFLFEKEEMLRESFVEVQVYKMQPSFFLLPAVYYEKKYEAALGRLLLDKELFADEIHRQLIPFLDTYLLTSFLPELKHILGHYLRDYQFFHPASIVLSVAHRQGTGGTEAFVLFEGSTMVLALYKEGNLLLANLYTYYTAMDVLYYFQLARKGAEMQEKHIRAFYMGESTIIQSEELSWEIYGIHWEEASMPPETSIAGADETELESWRYLLV